MRFSRKTIPRRFSLRTLLLVTTFAAIGIGAWYGKARQRLANLDALRSKKLPGVTVVVTPNPPAFLRHIGIQDMSPLFVQATVSVSLFLAENHASYVNNLSPDWQAELDFIDRKGMQAELFEIRNSAKEVGVDAFSVVLHLGWLVEESDFSSFDFDETEDGRSWNTFGEQNQIEVFAYYSR